MYGIPLDSRPPLGLTTHLPPSLHNSPPVDEEGRNQGRKEEGGKDKVGGNDRARREEVNREDLHKTVHFHCLRAVAFDASENASPIATGNGATDTRSFHKV